MASQTQNGNLEEVSHEKITAVDFLIKTATIIQKIEKNLELNRLDRKKIRELLNEYSRRAESDGRLMNAARQDDQCANRGLFLAYTHMELLCWLAKNNFNIPSSSIRWYSLRQFLPKYRIPSFWSSAKPSELKSQLNHIKRTAALVHADLQAHRISVPETAIEYPSVSVGEPATQPTECDEPFSSSR
ncbi:glyoxalase family protein [Penicillium manginii]|uniref:glyoxalase family protein n=1 Tax=Penicillium manginii TaxID=203109 RepID=UPI0025493B15|nr:glyoxalase family protein [Penicillium manginii]KAJ5763688.1 glyoxalase family protein [Penicillium manginii]